MPRRREHADQFLTWGPVDIDDDDSATVSNKLLYYCIETILRIHPYITA